MKSKRSFFILIILSMILILFDFSIYAYVWEGFEKENLWSVTMIKNNAVYYILSTSKYPQQVSEGRKTLLIRLGKTGNRRKGYLSREGNMDLSKISSMSFDLYTEEPLTLSIGLSMGTNYEWVESEDYKITKGWNKDIQCSLIEKKWKSETTSWETGTIPQNLRNTRKIVFVFKNGKKCRLYLDNIRFNGAVMTNIAYQIPYEPLDKRKLINVYNLLDKIILSSDTKPYAAGIKKELSMYELEYSQVDNVNKATYKIVNNLDWKEYSKLVLKVKNDSKEDSSLAFGIQTGTGWVWHESPQYLLKPQRTTRIVLNLTAPYYKSEDSNWSYNSWLYEKNDIKCFNIMIYGVPGSKNSGKAIIKSFELMKGYQFSPQPPEEEEEVEEEDEGDGEY